jgi:hypothetical protein
VRDSLSWLVGEVSQNAIRQNGGEQHLSSGKPNFLKNRPGGGNFPEQVRHHSECRLHCTCSSISGRKHQIRLGEVSERAMYKSDLSDLEK